MPKRHSTGSRGRAPCMVAVHRGRYQQLPPFTQSHAAICSLQTWVVPRPGSSAERGRSFYLSARAAFVWVRTTADPTSDRSCHIPLDGAPPSALELPARPIDQFSFREDATPTIWTCCWHPAGEATRCGLRGARAARTAGSTCLSHVLATATARGRRRLPAPARLFRRTPGTSRTASSAETWCIQQRSAGASLIGLHRIATDLSAGLHRAGQGTAA